MSAYNFATALHMMCRYILLITSLCFLLSCEKKENAIVLPPRGSASYDSVILGATYDKQIFYDFEAGRAVFSSAHAEWDLAFESGAGGRYIYLNGGQGLGAANNQTQTVCIYNTHVTSLNAVTSIPSGLSATSNWGGWRYDDVCYLRSRTAIGVWWDSAGASKKEVYLIQTTVGIQKFQVLSCDESKYRIGWQPLSDKGTPNDLILSKDTAYNFSYFSFDKGIVRPEPLKTTWDVVFTRYRDTILDEQSGRWIPYIVTGVLTNPYKTQAAADSVDDFSAIDLAKAQLLPLYPNRNVIGWNWKSYGLNSTGRYTVKRYKNYVIATQKDQLYKLHFLDYYGSNGQQGTPSFEYVRLK